MTSPSEPGDSVTPPVRHHTASATLPAPLRGITVPMVTPLRDRDTLDVGGLERLIEHILAGGVHGLFVLGTTGEGPSLSYCLRKELIERTCRQAERRVPVLVGITDTAFAESVRVAGWAADAGAAGAVVAPPYYFAPSQVELLEYLEHLVSETPLPLFLYNLPSHTKVPLAAETVRRAADLPAIVGLKDSSQQMTYFQRLVSIFEDRPDFTLLVGPEELLAESVLLGGHGGVNGGANLHPQLYVQLYQAAQRRDLDRLLALHRDVMQISRRIYHLGQHGSSYLKGLKCALSVLGIFATISWRSRSIGLTRLNANASNSNFGSYDCWPNALSHRALPFGIANKGQEMSVQQLVSYIAPGAPATRRPARGDEPFLRPEVGFTPRWYHDALGIDFGRRWHTDVSYRRETIWAMRRELRRRFPGAGIGGIDRPDAPLDLLTGVFGCCTVAALFGLPIIYAKNNWPNVETCYLNREQMAELDVPDLGSNPVFQDLLRQVDDIHASEGRVIGFVNWQGVLNNAQRLRGQDIFIDLYEAPEACHHLFATICDTMIDGIKRLQAQQRRSGVEYRFATVSNCLVNMISPAQYEEFCLPRDRRIAAAFATLGIHNCAWKADPYLGLYAKVPNLGYIDMGIESDLRKARALMPSARRALMYTPMDLANKPMDEILADLERVAREYGPCDIVLADIDSGTPDERILEVMRSCEELGKRYTTTHRSSDAP